MLQLPNSVTNCTAKKPKKPKQNKKNPAKNRGFCECQGREWGRAGMCAIDSEFLRGGGIWQERNAAALAERMRKRESSRRRQLGSFRSTQSASIEASRHPGCFLCLSALEDFLVRNYPSVYGKPVAHFWKPLRTEPYVCLPSICGPAWWGSSEGGQVSTGSLSISKEKGTVVVPVNRKADPLLSQKILPSFELILLCFFQNLEPVGLWTGTPPCALLSAAG